MAETWTAEQELAIVTRGTDLLVSAAAGAGKTAVLVERVIRTVLEGLADVDQLLVVTFTEAAAAELRERLAAALRRELARLEAGPEPAQPDTVARLHLQLALLGRASISTLHSFCLSVVQRYFHRVGVDPGAKVLAEEEARLLEVEVLDEVFEELYRQADPGFLALVDAYSSERDDEDLRRLVLRLYGFSRSHVDPDAWLDQAASRFEMPPGEPLEETVFALPAMEDIALSLEEAANKLRQAEHVTTLPLGPAAYAPVLADDVARVSAGARAVREQADALARGKTGDWNKIVEALRDADQFADLPHLGKDQGDQGVRDECRRIRNEAKAAVRHLVATFGERPAEDLAGELRALAGPMRAVASLVSRFAAAYRKKKNQRAVLDFSDLEHYCLAVLRDAGAEDNDSARGSGRLCPSDAALELRRRFVEVLVDEYQDINDVQQAILRLVSRGSNCFMVGDVKQSIYRFRLANAALFLREYYECDRITTGDVDPALGATPRSATPALGTRAVPPPSPSERPRPRRVTLSKNFRSRRIILDAVNLIFSQVMRPDAAELDYDSEAELRPGATFYGPAGEKGPPVELHLMEADVRGGPSTEAGDLDEDDPSPVEAQGRDPGDLHVVEREAGLIAGRIREMVEGRQPLEVYDPRTGAYRRARYGDIAILMRATTGLANLVVDTLTRAGIPATAQLSTGYFSATEVETVLSLLRLIDNPRQDIPLAAVLRSPVVGLTEADLALVRLCDRRGDYYDAVVAAAGGSGTGEQGGSGAGQQGGSGTGQQGRSGAGARGALAAVPAGLASRLEDFLAKLEAWRGQARRGPLSELLWRLYRETGLYAYVGGLPGGAQRQVNLRGLYGRAQAFDQFARQGLSRFLRFIDHLRETGGDVGPPQPITEGEDAVRVMSIHRSKGQEFPVVFLPHLGKRFNFDDATGDLICHRHLGFGPMVVDTARRLKYPSLASHAVACQNTLDAVAEEMRCLYVAMTRARDCLVLVGTRRKLAEALQGWCLPEKPEKGEASGRRRLSVPRVARARTYLDWLVPAVAWLPEARPLRDPAGYPDDMGRPLDSRSLWRFEVYGVDGHPGLRSAPPARIPGLPDESSVWDAISRLEPVPGAVPGRLTEALDWRYPHAELTSMRAKVSVSELKRLGDAEPDEDAAPLGPSPRTGARAGPRPLGASVGLSGGLATLRPAFLETQPLYQGPLERGLATHLLAQHADLSDPLDEAALAALAGSLAEREIMSPEQARLADTAAVARFFASDLGRRVAGAKSKVRREVPFTLGLPAGELYPEITQHSSRETVLVQGIIDILLDEPDGFTIIDLKTDRVTADDAVSQAEAYRHQIDLYRRAVETIWSRPVKSAVVYFLTPGVAVAL
ncbi:MAG: hypothetical protein C4551_07655 [Bacillota bacterium]|nr:MAG: hypothetical protein C4551_07655 [Bacillota bacterium]